MDYKNNTNFIDKEYFKNEVYLRVVDDPILVNTSNKGKFEALSGIDEYKWKYDFIRSDVLRLYNDNNFSKNLNCITREEIEKLSDCRTIDDLSDKIANIYNKVKVEVEAEKEKQFFEEIDNIFKEAKEKTGKETMVLVKSGTEIKTEQVEKTKKKCDKSRKFLNFFKRKNKKNKEIKQNVKMKKETEVFEAINFNLERLISSYRQKQ